MGRPVENNRGKKKKGRPSLLDLQKRSLRLQNKHQSPNPNPNPNPNPHKPPPNPYLRFPQPTARCPSRRSDDPDDPSDDPDTEADGEGGGSGSGSSKRGEKKLKLVLRIPPDRTGSDSPASGSEGDAGARTKKRPIGDVAEEKTEKHRSFSKAGELLENGTPLPDKKLLLFILERLQKKDTYGVFSEPVDAEELPDYHDIIEHPMDFGTIRKKLSCGVYANLEQFEKDVFLISSNAMRYNAPDTVYFRQARSIQDLAKKDFQNLRQASDEDEPEQKIARRGRPSTKNIFKKLVGRPPERILSNNNSDATLANSPDNSNLFRSSSDARKNMVSDKPSLVDLSNRNLLLSQTSENYSWLYDQRSEKNEEPSGSLMRNVVTRYGKKSVSEENHRNTCKRLLVSRMEPSVLSTFDGERKELVPVGLHSYAYARSLARFAVGLGPVAWEFAAKRLEMALPPGTKFGRGWVGEQDELHSHQAPILSVPPSSLPSQTSPCIVPSNMDRTAKAVGDLSDLTMDKTHPRQIMRPPSVAPSIVSKCSSPPGAVAAAEVSRIVSAQDVKPEASHGSLQSKVPLVAAQIHENSSDESGIKRKIASFGSNPSTGPVSRPSMQITSSAMNLPVTQKRELEVGSVKGNSIAQSASVSVSHVEVERTKFCSPRAVNSFNNFFHPPDSNDRAMEKVKLPPDSVHTASVSHVEADRVHINSSAALVSGSSFPNLVTGRFDVERSKNVVTMGGGNSILHPGNATTKHLEAERLKKLYTNLRNHGKNLTPPVLMSRVGAERTETSNYATISMNGFDNMSPLSHVEMEMSKLGNSGAMVVSSCADSVTTSNAETNKTRSGNRSESSCRILPESPCDSQGSWQQLPVYQKRDSTPDLNVRFQSPTSPPSGMVVDSQQPDLVLQL